VSDFRTRSRAVHRASGLLARGTVAPKARGDSRGHGKSLTVGGAWQSADCGEWTPTPWKGSGDPVVLCTRYALRQIGLGGSSYRRSRPSTDLCLRSAGSWPLADTRRAVDYARWPTETIASSRMSSEPPPSSAGAMVASSAMLCRSIVRISYSAVLMGANFHHEACCPNSNSVRPHADELARSRRVRAVAVAVALARVFREDEHEFPREPDD